MIKRFLKMFFMSKIYVYKTQKDFLNKKEKKFKKKNIQMPLE